MKLTGFPWNSLKTRMTALMLSKVLISLWALTFYASWIVRNNMEAALSQQQFSTASFAAAAINQELEERRNALEAVAGLIVPAMLGNATALQAFLEQRTDLQLQFNGGTFITRLDGTAEASLPRSAQRVGRNFMDQDHIAAALTEGKSVISTPLIGTGLRAPIFDISMPVRDALGKVIGALVGVTRLDQPNILDKIAGNRYGETGGFVLVEMQHRLIITATDKRRIMEMLPPSGMRPEVDQFIQGGEGTGIYVNSLGVEVLLAAKQIPAAGWGIVVSLPTAEAFSTVREMQQRLLIAALFVSLLAATLTWWLLSRQLSPMLAAMETLATMSKNGLHAKGLPITRNDEIGKLIDGFNHLLKSLGDREEALKQSEERWKFAIEGAGDGLWDWNIQTGVTYFSARYKEMYGYAEADFGATSDEWSKRIHPDDAPGVFAVLQPYMDGKSGSATVEFRMLCKDGSWKWTLGRGMVVSRDAHGKPLRMIGTNADIDARKQAEVELNLYRNHLEDMVEQRTVALTIAKEAAEAAHRAKTTFLNNMSHELRTPMNGIMGYTSLALGRATDPKQVDYLNEITRSSETLLALISDILEFSNVEPETLALDETLFILADVLESVSRREGQKAKYKGIELLVEVDPGLAVQPMIGDRQRLEHILVALTDNAIKFSIQGSVKVRVQAAEDNLDDLLLRFEVSDTGIGISAEDRQRLFTPFEQIDGSMTRKYGGAGLGLALSHRLARAMGGDMGVGTPIGPGSTFWFTVKLGKSAGAGPPA